MRVQAFGEILWDMIEGKPFLGGAPLNFAAHSAKCGAESHMISRLGVDDLGIKARAQVMQNTGVVTRLIQTDKDHPTGTVDIFLKDGQPSYHIHENVAYDFIDQTELELGLGSDPTDVFYFGSLAQRSRVSRDTVSWLLRNRDYKYRFYDVNLRKDCYNREILTNSLGYADIIKLSDEEVSEVSQLVFGSDLQLHTFLDHCRDRFNPEIIILTEGGKGCKIYESGKVTQVPGKKVKVVDAIGAGDSFSASFMYMYFHTTDAIKAATVANQVGAFVASSRGAIPDYTPEISALLQS